MVLTASDSKDKAMLSVTNGDRLRAMEVVALKVSDIDSKRMLIRVDKAKGGKDRYVHMIVPGGGIHPCPQSRGILHWRLSDDDRRCPTQRSCRSLIRNSSQARINRLIYRAPVTSATSLLAPNDTVRIHLRTLRVSCSRFASDVNV